MTEELKALVSEELTTGKSVHKVGGRYGGPGRIVGVTDDLDADGYRLYNVAMKVEGGYGEFVHVFPASSLSVVPDPRALSPSREAGDYSDYDAGLLNDFGGGNVEWWQDYLRAEIGRANDFWRDQVAPPASSAEVSTLKAEVERLRKAKDSLLKAFVARQDKAWMPLRAFRSEHQVDLDEARHEVWIEATDMARAALHEVEEG